jgi:hypothetical protein
MPERICVRCAKSIPPEARRHKYCSEACADSAQRAVIKARKQLAAEGFSVRNGTPRLLYRYYPKKEG